MRNFNWLGFFVIVGLILWIVIIGYFQFQGWIQCNADGGAYVRSWNGWPTCIKP